MPATKRMNLSCSQRGNGKRSTKVFACTAMKRTMLSEAVVTLVTKNRRFLCGERVRATRPHARYCSSKCRRAASRRRSAAGNARTPLSHFPGVVPHESVTTPSVAAGGAAAPAWDRPLGLEYGEPRATSGWRPVGDGADVPPIPPFLKR